jgi:outer membrane protein insertion porin family
MRALKKLLLRFLSASSSTHLPFSPSPLLLFSLSLLLITFVTAKANPPEYDGRAISKIEVVFEEFPEAQGEEDFLSLVRSIVGNEYSSVRIRAALQALFDTDRIANARVEVFEENGSQNLSSNGRGKPIRVRFVVKPIAQIDKVEIILPTQFIVTSVSEDEVRARLNGLEPGAKLKEQTLRSNADLIQAYLRDRGFFNAEVEHSQQINATTARAIVTFRVNPGSQSRVDDFDIEIKGFEVSRIRPLLKLQSGALFSRQALSDDIRRIRDTLIARKYLSPRLEEPVISRDDENNRITIKLKGEVGPKIDVAITDLDLSEKKQRQLLPVKRDGTIDQAAIVEGERRLRNYLQEDGYFFARVKAVCAVTPEPTNSDVKNGTSEFCQVLDSESLSSPSVSITYNVTRGRRLKLTEIRLKGTDKITLEDVINDLKTRKANPLGFVFSRFGYGRGYTSLDILEEDKNTIRERMRDLGYRSAEVKALRGASIDGENLIITFEVTENELTRVAGVEIRGNQIFTEDGLRRIVGIIEGSPFSRSQARAAGDRVLNLYLENGYVDAQLDFSIVELPKKGNDQQVKIVYTIEREGDKVFINRVLVTGNITTKREAILDSITLREGEVLTADDILESERILYTTDAFRQITIRTEPAGETESGFKKRDVIINVEELKPRILTYGGGYSTDGGPLGIFDLRNVNLFGKLQQSSFRTRISRRQQLLRLEYFNPRFRRYGEREFSPLTLSIQYTRDSNVTRFFRSAIDRGAFGIVQRLDANGNPIDEFGNSTGSPTINRFTFNAETQRIIDRKTRSIIFLRYRFEDVRLYKIGSLLIAPILESDRAVRLSGFGATFARDTRENCTGVDPNALPNNQTNVPTPCPYSATDATNGEYLAIDYGLSLRQLGSNISSNKIQLNYQRYYKIHKARGTVLAGRVTLGLANLFNAQDRDGNGVIDETDKTLPISERFFSGGSFTLRGFDFEEAGPRRVVPTCYLQSPIPQNCGLFRDRNGNLVRLDPFTVPVGGNALALVNLEARIPFTNTIQVVPFYDGGNVFRRVRDIFRKRTVAPNNIEDFNLQSFWSNAFGVGLRIKTPIGGSFAIDYGFLLNPPRFMIPQAAGTPAEYRLTKTQIHFRFSQAF